MRSDDDDDDVTGVPDERSSPIGATTPIGDAAAATRKLNAGYTTGDCVRAMVCPISVAMIIIIIY